MNARPGTSGVVRRSVDPSPADEWEALAPLLAAKDRMRLSPDLGRSYPGRGLRRMTTSLPSQPAAVLLYDHAGCAPVIALDLDSSRGNVARDFAFVTRLLNRHGARWFSDTSPNGGRHVYIPLVEPAPLHEVAVFMRSLSAILPTLDANPMSNIDSGCIRPPGSWHKSGGHQRLDQTISYAVGVFHRPLPTDGWRTLVRAVTPQPLATDEPLDATDFATDAAAEEHLEALHGWNAPDSAFTHIARTGQWPAEKYRSASEARQGVLWACAASGWRLVDVARRLDDGTWPGLASLYARYDERHRRTALSRDWRAALAFERRRRQQGNQRDRRTASRRMSRVRKRTTSTHQTQRGTPTQTTNQPRDFSTGVSLAPHRAVRVWLAAVDLLSPRLSPNTKVVLYALAEAAALTGRMEVEHGNRSLAIATGLDQATVGRVLKALREAPADMALVDFIRPAEGVRAHAYGLVVPPLLLPACEKKPWRRGRIHAVRPAFRALGMSAAFAYAVLERAEGPLSGREVARLSGLGHSASHDALLDLHAHGLAERTGPHGGWVLGDASLARLAEQFGCDEMVAEQIARYRVERLAWWRWLGVIADPLHFPEPPADEDEFPAPPPDDVEQPSTGPPAAPSPGQLSEALRWHDDVDALVGLLSKVLGASVVG